MRQRNACSVYGTFLILAAIAIANGALLPASIRAEEPAAAAASVPREQLKFKDRGFEEWRQDFLVELSPEIRRESLAALVKFARYGYAEETAKTIAAALNDDDEEFVIECLTAIESTGDAAVGPLTDALAKCKGVGRCQAAAFLAARGARSAAPAMFAALVDEYHWTMNTWGDDPDGAIDRMIDSVRARNIAYGSDEMRGALAQHAIGDYLTAHERLELLVNSLTALGESAATPALEAFQSDMTERKDIGFEVLQALGENAAAAAPAISENLADSEAIWRAAACKLLGSIGPAAEAELSKVLPLFNDPDRQVRIAAVGAIFRMAPDSEEVRNVVRKTVGGPDREMARAVFGSLFARRTPGFTDRSNMPGTPAAEESLSESSRARPEFVTELCVTALEAERNRATDGEDESDCVSSALYTIQSLGREAKAAAPVLAKFLEDPEQWPSDAVFDAVEAIGPTDELEAALRKLVESKPVQDGQSTVEETDESEIGRIGRAASLLQKFDREKPRKGRRGPTPVRK